MGYYSLLLLFLGILIIGTAYAGIHRKSTKTHLLFLFVLLLFLGIFFLVHHHFEGTCKILIGGDVAQVLKIIRSWGIAAPVISVLLMIMQAVIAPLPAFLITAANGMLFGLVWGTVISLLGALGGAVVSFFIARWIFISYAKKRIGGTKAEAYLHRISGQYGFKIVLIARLMPVISFDLISYAAGLSTISIKSFLLATVIGMFPATVVYTAFGSHIAVSQKYTTLLAIFSVGTSMVLIAIWLIQALRRRSAGRS